MQCSVESEGDDDGGDNCYPAGGVAVDGGKDTKIVKLIYILSCWLPVFTFLKVCTLLLSGEGTHRVEENPLKGTQNHNNRRRLWNLGVEQEVCRRGAWPIDHCM